MQIVSSLLPFVFAVLFLQGLGVFFFDAMRFAGIGFIAVFVLVLLQIVGGNPEEQQKMFGRHFEVEDELVSHISRRSIDLLKDNYRVSSEL